MSNIRARLKKLEQKQYPNIMEVVIIRFTGNGSLPDPVISGGVSVSYEYADSNKADVIM